MEQNTSWTSNSVEAKRFKNNFNVNIAWAAKAQLRIHALQDEMEEGMKLIDRDIWSSIRSLHPSSASPDGSLTPVWVYCKLYLLILWITLRIIVSTVTGRAMQPSKLWRTLYLILPWPWAVWFGVKSTSLPVIYISFFATFSAFFTLTASYAWAHAIGWYRLAVAHGSTIGYLW